MKKRDMRKSKGTAFRLVLFFMLVPVLICGSSYGAVIPISNIEDLQRIGTDPEYPLNGEYELTQDIDASDTINWNDGAGFAPIGTEESPFVGKLDGKGHKIWKLYINRYKENNVGLFGYIKRGGEVRNLGLENCWIIGGGRTGTLAGGNEGTVSNCYATGSVSGTELSFAVGGLMGSNGGIVSNCYSTSSVSCPGYRYSTYVGGLVGYIWSGAVSNCYATGNVSCIGSGYNVYVGGLVGSNSVTVSKCYATGRVSYTGNGDFPYVGGLMGKNGGKVSNCYATGSVSGNNKVGGLIGANSGKIEYCYSVGHVSGNENTGGLIGYNEGDEAINSYWDTETSGQSTSAGGEGKTTIEMKQQTTYMGWDFISVWSIQEGTSYPWLNVLGPTKYPSPHIIVDKDIRTLDELNKIGRDWSYPWDGHYTLMADIDASATRNWNGGKGFKPLPKFLGIFNGNGHKIRNLYINRPDERNIGLFGAIGFGGRISDLGLEDCDITGGDITGTLAGLNSGMVSNCYATGSVSGTESVSFISVGGLVGWNIEGTVLNCYANGSVSYTGNGNYTYAGGLVGENEGGMVSNCYATGSVSGTGGQYNTYVGGLVGWNKGGRVSNCYATGNVSGSGGYTAVGGLVGRTYGSVLNCYATGNVSGDINVGGLAGYNNGTVSNCYATGSVQGNRVIGGLVGLNGDGTVSNCYATGSVQGIYLVGGLVGLNYATVSNCYATGNVSGNEFVGGLIGDNDGPVSNSYWDIETSGRSWSDGGVGKTTAEMKQQSTYVGLDFSNIWTIQEGVTYPYFLQATVPSVVGMSQSSASSAITSAGLVVGVVTQQCSDTVPAGTVISQAPTSGTQVNKGSSVDIIVSTGPCTVSVPNVVDMTQDSASGAITSAGLVVGTVTQQCSNTIALGSVISQDPTADTQVSPGSSVNLIVSTGPCSQEGEGVIDGTPEGAVEGVVEGTPEGTPTEGAVESTPEGTSEGNPTDGAVEGTNQGEGEGSGGTNKKGCGCFGCNKTKGLNGDAWLKYLLDFVLVGMVITAMSGTTRKKK